MNQKINKKIEKVHQTKGFARGILCAVLYSKRREKETKETETKVSGKDFIVCSSNQERRTRTSVAFP